MAEQARRDRTTASILVVEDDANERAALAELLALQGYRVAQTATGEEAIRFAQELRPDVVLLDLVLPGLDGIEAARRLRSDPAIAHIPIIATTASWLGEKPELLASAGFDGALRKPFTGAELFEELEQVLSRAAREDATTGGAG